MSVKAKRYHYFNKLTKQTKVLNKEDKSLEKKGFTLAAVKEARERNTAIKGDETVTKGNGQPTTEQDDNQ